MAALPAPLWRREGGRFLGTTGMTMPPPDLFGLLLLGPLRSRCLRINRSSWGKSFASMVSPY
jgi:hypothetical protein